MTTLLALVALCLLGWLKAWVMLRDPSHPQYDSLPARWKRAGANAKGGQP